jgi:hypothetical protein
MPLKKFVLVGALLATCVSTPAYGAEDSNTSVEVSAGSDANGNGSVIANIEDQGTFNNRSSSYSGPVETGTLSSTPPATIDPNIDICNQPAPTQAVLNQCSVATPTLLGTPTPPPTGTPPEVQNYARGLFTEADLPKPQPVISAPEGICGVVHTLNLHIPVEKIYTVNGTQFGDVIIHVYGVVKVNWGDGSPIDSYYNGGADFPNSNIGHSYSTVGHYQITATATWTARITIGPYKGQTYNLSVGGVTTSGQISDFHVIQLQAVITEG